MNTERTPINAYLAIVAVSVIALGTAGAFLLTRNAALERTRLAADRAEMRRAVASSFAEQIKNAVAETEASLMASVRRLPPDNPVSALRTMQESDPLIRNVFLWKRGEGLLWPRPDSATADEDAFLRRDADLFSPKAAWGVPDDAEHGAPRSPLPRFEGSQLYLLAWTRIPSDPALIAGVEIETVALLSRFHRLMRGFPADTVLTQLRDGAGAALFSTGETETETENFGDSISLSPALPHWTLAYAPAGFPPEPENPFALPAAALLGLSLLVSVCAGATLLARDARRQRRDALNKTAFVSNVSHELRTPLTSIRMYAEMLADDKAGNAAQSAEFLRIIADESRRLSALVSDILELGRKKPAKPQTCDAAEILASLGIPCPPRETCQILANPDALRQILINLADNAEKYAGSPPTAEINAAAGAVSIAVLDRGPGIPPRLAKRIFEPFFRADDSNTATVGGFGLGLAIARKLAADMRGTLEYSPRPGGGSVFTLTLPAAGKK